MASGKYKNLTKRTKSVKFLKNQASKIANNSKYDWYQRGFASILYTFFDKKSDSLPDKTAKGSDIKSMSNQQLENKPIIRQLKQEEFLLDLRKMLALLI